MGGEGSAPAHHPGADCGPAGQVTDTPVPELDEMGGGETASDQVVRPDEGVLAVVAEAIDQDVWNLLLAQVAHARVSEEAARQDNTVNATRLQALQVGPLPLGGSIRVAEQHV